jgi:hypothetical protein
LADLHRDGIVGVAADVPAGILAGVGEKRTGTGDVFFGVEGVNLEFGFVAVVRDGEETDAMDGGSDRAELGNGGAEVEPSEVNGIGDKEKSGENGRDAREETDGRRGWRRSGHANSTSGYCAPGGVRKQR